MGNSNLSYSTIHVNSKKDDQNIFGSSMIL